MAIEAGLTRMLAVAVAAPAGDGNQARLRKPRIASQLARHVFGPPTYYYKTGIAFLSWLSGHQPGFTMIGGLQSARSPVHLAEVYRLADEARLFPDPATAARRMTRFLAVSGLER